jgi:hypothetical protein
VSDHIGSFADTDYSLSICISSRVITAVASGEARFIRPGGRAAWCQRRQESSGWAIHAAHLHAHPAPWHTHAHLGTPVSPRASGDEAARSSFSVCLTRQRKPGRLNLAAAGRHRRQPRLHTVSDYAPFRLRRCGHQALSACARAVRRARPSRWPRRLRRTTRAPPPCRRGVPAGAQPDVAAHRDSHLEPFFGLIRPWLRLATNGFVRASAGLGDKRRWRAVAALQTGSPYRGDSRHRPPAEVPNRGPPGRLLRCLKSSH